VGRQLRGNEGEVSLEARELKIMCRVTGFGMLLKHINKLPAGSSCMEKPLQKQLTAQAHVSLRQHITHHNIHTQEKHHHMQGK
jgi:hypothetical protein